MGRKNASRKARLMERAIEDKIGEKRGIVTRVDRSVFAQLQAEAEKDDAMHAAQIAAQLLSPDSETAIRLGREEDGYVPTAIMALPITGTAEPDGSGDMVFTTQPGIPSWCASASVGTLDLGTVDSQIGGIRISPWRDQLAAVTDELRANGHCLRVAPAMAFTETKGSLAMGIVPPGSPVPNTVTGVRALRQSGFWTVNELVEKGSVCMPALPTTSHLEQAVGTALTTVDASMWEFHSMFSTNVGTGDPAYQPKNAWKNGIGQVVVVAEDLSTSASFAITIEEVVEFIPFNTFIHSEMPDVTSSATSALGARVAHDLLTEDYMSDPLPSGKFDAISPYTGNELVDDGYDVSTPAGLTKYIVAMNHGSKLDMAGVAARLMRQAAFDALRPPPRHLARTTASKNVVRKEAGELDNVVNTVSKLADHVVAAWQKPKTGIDLLDTTKDNMGRTAQVLAHALGFVAKKTPAMVRLASSLL
jgi:hypothetical protein